jgi:hypothetical protein
MKTKIIERLLDLNELDGVTVEVTGHKEKTVVIQHARHHVPNYKFKWVTDDHFVGYIVDQDLVVKNTQALVTLRTPLDAILFASSYVLNVNICARQRA